MQIRLDRDQESLCLAPVLRNVLFLRRVAENLGPEMVRRRGPCSIAALSVNALAVNA